MTSEFTPNSEAYLAAVWYAMKDAEERFKLDAPRIEAGRLGKWGYLRKIQQMFGADPVRIPYSQMRLELQNFAATFGVPGAPSVRDLEAADVFTEAEQPVIGTTHRRGK